MHKGTFTETTKNMLVDLIKARVQHLRLATAAIGNAAGEALVNGNKEPMKKALEDFEREVNIINNLEKVYEKKDLVLISLICSDEMNQIRQIIENIDPDFIRNECGIEK